MPNRKLPTFRTKETEEKYYLDKCNPNTPEGCAICAKEPILKFKYWKIIENSFPYDRISTLHHMIAPLRHTKFGDINQVELDELKEIRDNEIDKTYGCIIESTSLTQSIPKHFHLHLIVTREFDE
jgi:hypothetical protein